MFFRKIGGSLEFSKKITPRGMRRTSKDLLRISGAPQVVAMAINGHYTEEMHNHYSTVNELEIREVLMKTTKLMGLVPSGPLRGGESGVGPAMPATEKGHARRAKASRGTARNYSLGVLICGRCDRLFPTRTWARVVRRSPDHTSIHPAPSAAKKRLRHPPGSTAAPTLI